MNSPEQIKQILSPTIVAQHYLGQGKTVSGRLWYKSPFRKERTASFLVDDKGFHDFGDGWDGDVIDFIEKFYQVGFTQAIQVLQRDFNLPDSEKISKEVEVYLKKRQEENKTIQENLDKWYNDTYISICSELQRLEKEIPKLRQEALTIAYDRHASLSILWELFFEVKDDNEKLELWRNRKEINKCLDK